MTWMNEYEVDDAVRMFADDPVLGPAAMSDDRIFLNPSFIDGETAEDREHRLIHWTLDHPLVNVPCDCPVDTGFRCYPADGECECGCWKHHVHNQCGHIVQWG